MWTRKFTTTTLIQKLGNWRNSVGFSESKKNGFFFCKSTWKSGNLVPFHVIKATCLELSRLMLNVTHTALPEKKIHLKKNNTNLALFCRGEPFILTVKGFLLNKKCWTCLTCWDFINQIGLSSRCCFLFLRNLRVSFPFRTGELQAWDSVGWENWSRERGVVEHPAGKTWGWDWWILSLSLYLWAISIITCDGEKIR